MITLLIRLTLSTTTGRRLSAETALDTGDGGGGAAVLADLEDETVLLLEDGVGRLAGATCHVLRNVLLQQVLKLFRLEATADGQLLVLSKVTSGTCSTTPDYEWRSTIEIQIRKR